MFGSVVLKTGGGGGGGGGGSDNGQPGAGASFSLNGVNALEILLSLWSSKMIQSGQISIRTKSVTAVSTFSLTSALEEL